MPGAWVCRRRSPGRSAHYIEVPSWVCSAYAIAVSLSDVNKRFGWDRKRTEAVLRDEYDQKGATADGNAPESQEI